MNQAIYLRTSTEEQNPENQLNDCKTLIDGKFLLFQDKQSAWKEDKERPNFEKLSSLILRGQIIKLCVWDLDRIYRNRKKLKSFFEMCKVNNCRVYSFRQNFLSELQDIKLPEGFEFIKDIMINNFIEFLGWIAEDESKKKSERVKAAIRIKDGQKISYKGNAWGRNQISTFKKNQIVKFGAEKLSIRQIAKKLNLSIGAVHKYLPKNSV